MYTTFLDLQLTGAFIFTNMLYLEDWILFRGSMWGQKLQDPNFFKLFARVSDSLAQEY